MLKRRNIYILVIVCGLVFLGMPISTISKDRVSSQKEITMNKDKTPEYKVKKTDSEWKKELSPDQYNILRKKGTERPFTGIYYTNKTPGTYYCAGCGQELFKSSTKFDSGCGWPSFYAPLIDNNINIKIDKSYGMTREEVLCSKCGGHLGHVFNDGPPPTGKRYCINSGALVFKAKGGNPPVTKGN